MLRRLALVFFLFAVPAWAAPAITVSASAVTLLGSSQNISITVQLIDPNNTGLLKVAGTGIVPVMRASTVTPGATATVGPIYGNDVITDAYGAGNTTYYQVQVFTVGAFVNATPAFQQFYAFTGSGTVDLATATPLAPSYQSGPNGNVTVPGALTAHNINNIIAVDGVHYTTLNAALADPQCTGSSLGCTIDMRGNSSSTALALGTVTASVNAVTVLLGPYTYTLTQFPVTSNLHIYGSGSEQPGGTLLQSNNTSTDIFALASGVFVAAGFQMDSLRVYCGASNTNQIAFHMVAPTNGGGLWYSGTDDVFFGGDGVHECAGGSIVLDGSAGGSPAAINQWLRFANTRAFRTQGGNPAVHLIGVNGQITFDDDQFDGQTPRDTGTNVLIEDSAFNGFTAAYSIGFYQTTIQRAGIGLKLRGTTDVTCDTCHFEDVSGMVNEAMGQHYGNFGTIVRNSYCATACAVSSGSGYLVTMDANSQLAFDNNSVSGTPDNFYLGTLTNFEHQGLMNFNGGTLYTAPASSMRIPVGIDSDSPGFKFVTISTGAITATTRASVAVTWATPFVDASYAPFCFADDFTTGGTSQGVIAERVNGTLLNTGFNVTVYNPTGGTVTSNLFCWAVHK